MTSPAACADFWTRRAPAYAQICALYPPPLYAPVSTPSFNTTMLAQSRELDLAKGRLQKSETDLDEQLALNQTKLVENQAISNELRKTGSDIATLHQEVSRATKLKDAQLKKIKVIERDGLKNVP